MKKLILYVLATYILLISTSTYPVMLDGAIVKLYSEGKLIATYEAKPGGHLVGSCYVFESKSELHEKLITVCGTFSVEEIQ